MVIGGKALTRVQRFRIVQPTIHLSIKFTNLIATTYEYDKIEIKMR